MRPGDDEYKLRDIFRNFDVISSICHFGLSPFLAKLLTEKLIYRLSQA